MTSDQITRLFVGGLKYDVTKDDIHTFFEAAGVVEGVYLALDHERGAGRNRGFAFVEMSTPLEARQAIQMFNNKPGPGGRKIGVKLANVDQPS